MSNSVREFNVESLFHLVTRRWGLLLLIPVLTVLAAALAWQVVPDRYQSTARLLIQDQQTVNPFLKDMLEQWSAKQRMPLVESIFRSHDTSERVLRKLGRLDNLASPEEVNQAVQGFQDGLQVIGLGGELVLIKVQGATPIEAYKATTELIDAFTEQIVRPQRETVRASAAFFEDQLEQLHRETDEADPQVAQLPEARKGSPDEQLSLRRALAQAEVRLVTAEQAVARSEAKLRQRKPEGTAGSRQYRRDLADARRELAELRSRYGASHPELVAARERVQWLQRAVRRERKSADDAATETSGSETVASEGTSESDESPAARHQKLLIELKEARAAEGLLRQRLLTEELSMFAEGNQVWTVERPVLPTRSLNPPIWIVLPTALFAGLILAFLAVAFFALFDDSLRGERELAEALGAPSLGRMPRGEA